MRFVDRRGKSLYLILLLAVLLSGCSGFELPRLSLPASPTAPPPAQIFPTQAPQPVSTSTTEQNQPGEQTLIVWLPPQFDPRKDGPAGDLLRSRLAAFEQDHPGVRVRVRVKAQNGDGGLMESLAAANAAAPGAVPSLIALTRSDLEVAALKGLVYSLDGLTKVIDQPDWYPYAREMAQIQGSTFGLPFGGDALLLVYRPARLGPPPADWNAILRLGQPLAFPAADPQSLFSLTLYQMLGGTVEDDQRRPTLQPEVLAKAFKLYWDGIQQGVFPYWLSQLQTDDQAWTAYQEQRAQWLVTWSSIFLSQLPADSAALALPSVGEKPLTQATGWVWALSEPDEAKHALSAELAEYLVDPAFQGAWSAAARVLPVRPSALEAWNDASLRGVISQVVSAAHVRPSIDMMASLGPALETATIQVIKRESDPAQAAQSAADRLAIPGVK